MIPMMDDEPCVVYIRGALENNHEISNEIIKMLMKQYERIYNRLREEHDEHYKRRKFIKLYRQGELYKRALMLQRKR